MICQHSHAFIQQTFTRDLWSPGSVEEDGHTSAVPDTIMKHTEAGGGQGGANTSLPCVVLEGKRGAELSVGLWTNDSRKGVSSPSLHCLLETPVLSRESSASLLTPGGLRNRDRPWQLHLVYLTLFLGPVCAPDWLPTSLFHEPVESLSPMLLSIVL